MSIQGHYDVKMKSEECTTPFNFLLSFYFSGCWEGSDLISELDKEIKTQKKTSLENFKQNEYDGMMFELHKLFIDTFTQ